MRSISAFSQVIDQASRILLDKRNEIELALVCLLAKGHLLIEDQPGVGKTTLVQALSKLCSLKTTRIQFTSDLLPADILGNSIWNQDKKTFEFYPGPLFSQSVLADELNRASPRTQSALLQAMEEAIVTIDGKVHELPQPFFVIATQNPMNQIGTFPLPESQLDRFMMSLELHAASPESEKMIFRGTDTRHLIKDLAPVFSSEEFLEQQAKAEGVMVSPLLADYIYSLLEKSRRDFPQEVVSTRAGIALSRAGRACALLQGRSYCTPDDIQKVFLPVMGHRLAILTGVKQGRQRAQEILQSVAVPI